MKKSIIAFFLCICFFSCENHELTDQANESTNISRNIFSSSNAFYEAFDDLSRMEYDEQLKWVEANNDEYSLFKNIDSCNDEIMLKMPRSFQALFNKDLEVQVSDTILAFENGDLYIKEINGQTISKQLYGNVEVSPISNEIKANEDEIETRYMYEVGPGKIGTSYQYEFKLPENSIKFKYVHELVSVKIASGSFFISKLFLVIKLEYKGSKWKVASEPREVFVDLNIERRLLKNVRYNVELFIEEKGASSLDPHKIYINGAIWHTVVGYPSSKKCNSWSAPGLPWS